MNNNYNTKRRLNDNIYLELKDKIYDDDSSSSDSVFSDGFDSRLDEDFNEMISQIKKKRKVDEQQLGDYKEDLIETHIERMENGAAIQKFSIVNVQGNEISITTANESYDVDPSITYESSENPITVEKISVNSGAICVKQEPFEVCQSIENDIVVDKTAFVNDIEQMQDTPKSNRMSIANEYDDNTSSSDTASSDEFDSRLDEDFNEMISQIKEKGKVDEQQLCNFKGGLIETHNPIENAQTAEKLSIVTVHRELSTFPEEIQDISVVESIATNQASGNGAAAQKISVVDVPEEIQGNNNSTSTKSDSYGMDLIVDSPSRSLKANESYVVTPIATNQASENDVTAQKISTVDVLEEIQGNKNSTSTSRDSYVVYPIEHTPNRTSIANESNVVEPISTNQASGNGASVYDIFGNDQAQGNKAYVVDSENGVAVDETFVNNNNNNKDEIQEVLKNDPITIANESYVLDHQLKDLSVEIEIEEEDDGQLSILHSTTSNSMLPNTDLDDSNWTDYESDVTNVTYN